MKIIFKYLLKFLTYIVFPVVTFGSLLLYGFMINALLLEPTIFSKAIIFLVSAFVLINAGIGSFGLFVWACDFIDNLEEKK